MFTKISLIKFFLNNIELKKKIELTLLIFLISIVSILEFISLGSIVPLIANLLDYGKQNYLSSLPELIGFEGDETKFFVILFVVIIIITSLFRIFVLNFSLRVNASIVSNLGSKMFRRVINQPYKEFVNTSSNIIISGMTDKINSLENIILSLFNLFSGLLISTGIFIALLVFNFKITLFVVFLLIFSFIIIGFTSRSKLNVYSKIVANLSDKRIQFLQETFGNIKEIILGTSQEKFTNLYAQKEKKFRITISKINFLTNYPRILVETIGIIILLVSILFFFNFSQKTEIITTLGVFAFAANKLLPQVNIAYQSWATVSGTFYFLEDLANILKMNNESAVKIKKDTNNLNFYSKLIFKNLSFFYDEKKLIFKNLNLTIDLNNKKIGIIGSTGRGKSTLVDLITGILKPSIGEIFLDNRVVDENISKLWKDNIAYVPQNIFLINDTISNNISFPDDQISIDRDKIKKSIKIACLENFINQLNTGYNSFVGENGINISGGQKQRIGIARAIYKNKKILILDEATSALDYETEKSIYENIFRYAEINTLISITHRKENLNKFDYIIDLDKILTN